MTDFRNPRADAQDTDNCRRDHTRYVTKRMGEREEKKAAAIEFLAVGTRHLEIVYY